MRSVESGVVVLGSSAEARVWHDRQPENVICSTTATLPPVFVRRNAANFVLAIFYSLDGALKIESLFYKDLRTLRGI